MGRRGTAHIRTLEEITFTAANIKTEETQKLLTETLETFLRDVAADPDTKFPLKTTKRGDASLNESKTVADFLKAGKIGGKKKKAEDMLKAVCKLRGVTSEYFRE